MKGRIRIIADSKIPFLKGRLEPVADVEYLDPREITADKVRDCDALLVRTRTKCGEKLLKGSDVKLVVTATIGTDHIDIPWCEGNGITVRNAAGCNAPGVAQYVWSSLLRNGFKPSIHTLGVVGYGHVGSIVAAWGKRLGARVLVCDPPRHDERLDDREYLPLALMIAECDAITLHTPLTSEGPYPTFHLLGEEQFAAMAPGKIIINAARGPVTDTGALKEYVTKKRGVAIIDTWEGEPDIDRELLRLVRTGTPHIAGYSLEGKQRATRMALTHLEDYFGFSVDKSGLAPDYHEPEILTPEKIMKSYDPDRDTATLRENPHEFEKIRSEYNYRPETY